MLNTVLIVANVVLYIWIIYSAYEIFMKLWSKEDHRFFYNLMMIFFFLFTLICSWGLLAYLFNKLKLAVAS